MDTISGQFKTALIIIFFILSIALAGTAVYQRFRISGLTNDITEVHEELRQEIEDNGVLRGNQQRLLDDLKTANASIDLFKAREEALTQLAQDAVEKAQKDAVRAIETKVIIRNIPSVGKDSCERIQNLADELINLRLGVTK